MTFDAGRVRHDGALMHYSRGSNGSSVPSNWKLSATGDTGVTWTPESAGGGVSYGSNANAVGTANAPGASTNVSRADHVHLGVRGISSNSSNTLVGDVNLQAGSGIALGVSGQTISIVNTGSSGGGGGGTTITTKDEGSTLSTTVTTLDFVGSGVTASGAGATTTVTISGGGSSGLTLLEQYTASSSASLNFTTAITSTYDEYLFEFLNIIPASDSILVMRMHTGGAYDSTSGHYSYVGLRYNTGGVGAEASTSTTYIPITSTAGANDIRAASTTWGYSGHLRLFNPGSTSVVKMVEYAGNYMITNAGGTRVMFQGGGAFEQSGSAVDGVQFLMSTGNIASGTIRCYGIAK